MPEENIHYAECGECSVSHLELSHLEPNDYNGFLIQLAVSLDVIFRIIVPFPY